MRKALIFAGVLLAIGLAIVPLSTATTMPHRKPPAKHTSSGWKHARVLATAYVVRHDHGCATYTDRTASGSVATNGTAATDPTVFPTGTKFIVSGYGYAIARDTGNFVKGHHIDLAVMSCKAAYAWGARSVSISYKLPEKS